MAAHAAACLDLPEELWPLILSKMPLSQRLGSCSRVSSKLHKAAVAATTSVVLANPRHDALAESFPVYLSKHGQHLTSIRIVQSEEPAVHVPDLPCPNLQHLDLEECKFYLGKEPAGFLQACTGLTYLSLSRGWVVGQQPSIAALTALTKLQHLELNVFPDHEHRCSVVDAPSTLLRGLPQLTHLSFGIHSRAAVAVWLKDLSRLTKLQELCMSESMTCSPSTTPGLSQLTALTSLVLGFVRLDPTLLLDISTQLQCLHIGEGVGLEGPDGPDLSAAIRDRAARLMSCIAGMTHLQQLRLNPLSLDLPAEEAAAYTALTASSSLRQLQLCDNGWREGIWQAVFPEGHTVPNLRSMRGPKWAFFLTEGDPEPAQVYFDDSDLDSDELEPDPEDEWRRLPDAAFNAADLSAVVSCCPGLQTFGLCVRPDVSLSPLSSLTTLMGLRVEAVTDASMQSLAAVTQLRWLSLKLAEQGVRVTSLVGLTALRRLELLQLDAAAVRLPEEWDGVKLDLSTTCSTAPDVWRQLLEQCADNTHCQPLVIDSLSELHSSQQQQGADPPEEGKQGVLGRLAGSLAGWFAG